MPNNNIYSVSQINKYIGGMFKDDLLMGNVSIKGEVGTLSTSGPGHIYFSIKDDKSQISAVIWASKRANGLKFQMKTGMQVVVTGTVEVYEAGGKYQIIANTIEEDGQGDLYRQFLEIKNRLESQGLFDATYKRPIPSFVKTLGVVTASTGAAIRDIVTVAQRRYPGIQIILAPSMVQGKEAPMSIISAIQALEKVNPDCIIVGRGGGSMEDLWCFNDEMLAQVIFNCSVPVISAVGHERDFTIADFVADLRAATPSQAAELAVRDIQKDVDFISNTRKRLDISFSKKINEYRQKSKTYDDKLRLLNPKNRLEDKRKTLNNFESRMNREIKSKINEYRNSVSQSENSIKRDMGVILGNYKGIPERFSTAISNSMEKKLLTTKNTYRLLCQKLEGLSPITKLSGGYGFISDINDRPVTSINAVKVDSNLRITLKDGEVMTTVNNVKVNE